jgi:hypothetical protein
MTSPTSPPCMTPDEFASWSEANAVCSPRYQASSPCEDCTQEFAREMRGLGLCVPPATDNAQNVRYRKSAEHETASLAILPGGIQGPFTHDRAPNRARILPLKDAGPRPSSAPIDPQETPL